jgi:hypothetical protein
LAKAAKGRAVRTKMETKKSIRDDTSIFLLLFINIKVASKHEGSIDGCGVLLLLPKREEDEDAEVSPFAVEKAEADMDSLTVAAELACC